MSFSPRKFNPVWLLLISLIVVLLISLHQLHSERPTLPLLSLRPYSDPLPIPKKLLRLSCVRADMPNQAQAGLGSVLKLSQLAVFIASYYDAKMQYPSVTSNHGYEFSTFFSDCEDDFDRNPAPSKGAKDPCVLDENEVELQVCHPRPNCECLEAQVRPHVAALMDRGCRAIVVTSDRYRKMVFSGCLRGVLARYFGAPVPKRKYDVIHYRTGDISEKRGNEKMFSEYQLWFFVRELCRRSRRDIIVLTQGEPKIAECPPEEGGAKRIVLAGDTSIPEAFGIMQHAKTICVGHSSFAMAMLEIARPERIILSYEKVGWYEWFNCENWIVLSKPGAAFNFGSKELLLEYSLSSRNLDHQRYQCTRCLQREDYNMSVPRRRWTSKMMSSE